MTYWHVVDVVAGLTHPCTTRSSALRGETWTVLSARHDGHLLATPMVGHPGHRGRVYDLAVLPANRAEEVGSLLMREAEDWLRTRGAVKLQLMVRHSNEAVVSFYEHLGDEEADVTVMSRWLRTPVECPVAD